MKELSREKSEWLRGLGRLAIDVLPGYGAFFKSDFLRNNNLAAAIFGGDFRDNDEVISRICSVYNIHVMYSISLDDTRITPSFSFFPSHANLKIVRKEYHVPSYFVSDEKCNFLIVSDSDYYWGFASSAQLVSLAKKNISRLVLTENEILGFVQSKDHHNSRIGNMLQSFINICDLANSA